jgi:hypothetical protein
LHDADPSIVGEANLMTKEVHEVSF